MTHRGWGGPRAAIVVVVGLVAALPIGVFADEGFWPFNRIPRTAIARAYGVELGDAWLQRVQQASVRFPSGSGSFVSADGLVLTNHHVALDIVQRLSDADRDLVSTGFVARDRAQEITVPDLELVVLQTIADVTAQVNAAVTPRLSSAEALAARRAAIAALESGAAAGTVYGEVVTLYQGAQYHLYQYKRFTDVRLVFVPEFDIAFYGGDPDNFTFPRYALDMALFRVYEHGRPLSVRHFLPWSTRGARDGEVVFTSGHPAATQRLNTVAHLEALRDHSLPINLEMYTRIRDALGAYRAQGAEQDRQAKDLFFGMENSLKSWTGQLAGLRDPAIMSRKVAAEAALRAAVAGSPAYRERFGGAWDAVASARRALPSYNMERVMVEGGLALYSDYFSMARTLVRWAAERQRPNGERLPEYTDARRASLERQVGAAAPIHPGLEQARLTESLALMRDKLGADHAVVRQILDGQTPAVRARALVAATTLGDAGVRLALFAGGAAAVAASDDPFIAIARALEPRARALRTRHDHELLAVERDAYAKIAQAVFATQGDAAYPDGTFTLRLSYGTVKGYRDGGDTVSPFTDLRGLYVRADEHAMKPPYKYPERWAKARAALALDTPFNFVSTNDIVGGNSGSPVINAAGELVGLVFDGNSHSLPGYYVYDPAVNRAVSVDVRGMIEALRKVYGAEAVVGELLAVAVPTAAR